MNSTSAHTNERFDISNNLIKIPILNHKNRRRDCPNVQRNPLSFILSNVRSLLPKVDELDAILKLNYASMAFITETWLNQNIDDEAVQIHGYSLIGRDRKSRAGGGVCAYIKTQIPFKILTCLQDVCFETLWLYLRPHKLFRGFSCLVVCVVYHHPSSDNNALIKHLTIKLGAALSMYPNAGILLVEDFNKCPVSAILRHFTLKQIVKQPTRGYPTLDLILTNMSDFCNTPLVISPIGRSDHDSVLCSYKEGKTKNVLTKVDIRQGNNAAKSAFGMWLSHCNWTVLYYTISCEQKLDLFQDVISTGLDCFLPTKTVKLHDKDKPWIIPEYKKIIETRQKAFHHGKSLNYLQLRNQVNRESKKLRSAFLEKKLEQLKLNPNLKKRWQSIKQLSGYPKRKSFQLLSWAIRWCQEKPWAKRLMTLLSQLPKKSLL